MFAFGLVVSGCGAALVDELEFLASSASVSKKFTSSASSKLTATSADTSVGKSVQAVTVSPHLPHGLFLVPSIMLMIVSLP